MALKIERGVRHGARKVAVAGIEGIGKTTLVAQFPDTVILDTENGSSQLDAARVRIESWDHLLQAVASLGSDHQGFKTIAIDSADWAESLLVDHLCAVNKWDSIESAGYGKGYTALAEQFGKFLSSCDGLIGTGLHVVFTAHTTVKRVSPPELTDGYDRYELKLSKQVSPLLREWVDLLLFCTFETNIVEGKDGRKKATGGKRRVMHTEPCAAWTAKNRFGLDAKLPMEIESLASIFAEPQKKLGWRERVAQAATLDDLERIENDADKAVTAGKLTAEQRETLRESMAARSEEIGAEVTA
jgi:hypothetical protein